MNRIVSSLPGRIRVRLPQLRDAARLARLHDALAACHEVRDCQFNPATGSLLLHYDPAACDPQAMENLVDEAVDAELAAPRPETPAIRANRASKRIMLGSLAISLGYAALGRKRPHIIAGGIFLAALAVHLSVHRKRLLK